MRGRKLRKYSKCQEADHHHRRQRPCRGAQPRDNMTVAHWITSSAVANSVSGMVRPSAMAVLRLITVAYFVRPPRLVARLLALARSAFVDHLEACAPPCAPP